MNFEIKIYEIYVNAHNIQYSVLEVEIAHSLSNCDITLFNETYSSEIYILVTNRITHSQLSYEQVSTMCHCLPSGEFKILKQVEM